MDTALCAFHATDLQIVASPEALVVRKSENT